MTLVKRFDAGTLKNVKKNKSGYLRAPAFATRTGVFAYREPDGKVRRELRHPDDVFDAASLETLAGAPLTLLHPQQMLDATNTKAHIVGTAGQTVTQEGQYVKVDPVMIMDADAIKAVEVDGMTELSCGYYCNREDEQGVYDGQPYDCRQKNIIYNHLAIVPKGRAGPDVCLRLDAADAVQVEDSTIVEEKKMKFDLGGKTIEVNDADAAVLTVHLASLASATAKEKTRADSAEGKADALKVDLDKKDAELKARTDAADPANVRKMARELNRVETVARKILDKETIAKLDSMDERAIKVAVIKADVKDVNLDGKSDGYIDARFDAIAERQDKNGVRLDAAGAALVQQRQDGANDVPDSEAARKRQRDASINAWKPEASK